MEALGWWIVATTVRPRAATAATTFITTAADRESRPGAVAGAGASERSHAG
jgi:hypothetical protein